MAISEFWTILVVVSDSVWRSDCWEKACSLWLVVWSCWSGLTENWSNGLVCLWIIDDNPTKTLIVKNLSFNITKEALEEAFQDSNRIGLPKHQDTGKLKGWFTLFQFITDFKTFLSFEFCLLCLRFSLAIYCCRIWSYIYIRDVNVTGDSKKFPDIENFENSRVYNQQLHHMLSRRWFNDGWYVNSYVHPCC